MNAELIERLFALAESVALDLGALNVQRGRDHALPFYNQWRQYCNLTFANTFDDLKEEIKSEQVCEFEFCVEYFFFTFLLSDMADKQYVF